MFDDIRPYRDDEIAFVIKKLIKSKELQTSLAQLQLPLLYKFMPNLSRYIIQWSLKFRARKFTSIDKIQVEVAKYLHQLIENSTYGFSFSGIENLDTKKPSLFISNHRDIVLDVALVNLALYTNNFNTVEAAVGDNLLQQQWVADLMRINKSFIVKRSTKNKRAMLKASKQLSAYIHDSITNGEQNIWIAQREGRAKDGLDQTNPALISMLLLNKEKTQSISEYLSQLNIIPVSISYQFDPCDQDKAIELAERETTGHYQKHDGEDLKSITKGLTGQKGQVHLAFAQAIEGEYQDSKAIAAAIDQAIISNYKLYDSNLTAHEILTNDSTKNISLDKTTSIMANQLTERMLLLNPEQQRWLLTMYANPVFAKNKLCS